MNCPPPALDQIHLADTTAWSRARSSAVAGLDAWFDRNLQTDRIATCDLVVIELLRSARDLGRLERQSAVLSDLRWAPSGARQFSRAREVQRMLAEAGQHRGVAPADLLIAASAEAADLPLLHYDRDYDLISEVTGQATRWLMPHGQLP